MLYTFTATTGHRATVEFASAFQGASEFIMTYRDGERRRFTVRRRPDRRRTVILFNGSVCPADTDPRRAFAAYRWGERRRFFQVARQRGWDAFATLREVGNH